MESFTLSWPDAFAIVGSIVTVVAAVLAGYMSYLKDKKEAAEAPKSQLPSQETVHLHDRISSLKDRVAELDSDNRVLKTQIENLAALVKTHSERDIDDFKDLNTKVDKLMEIIVEMLKDDH